MITKLSFLALEKQLSKIIMYNTDIFKIINYFEESSWTGYFGFSSKK